MSICARVRAARARPPAGWSELDVVATSRERLRVPGEARVPWDVPAPGPGGRASAPAALSAFASVQLILDRGSGDRPGFALTPGELRRGRAHVPRPRRHALAIELAAARVRSMSDEANAAHLTGRFAVVTGATGPRRRASGPSRGDRLELRPLRDAGARALARLAVFAGGFALDAAAAVGTGNDLPPGEVLDALGHLVDKSLVAFDARKERYRLLETVRQYALERLVESGDEAGNPRPASRVLRGALGTCGIGKS